ncbi:MAG: hypothetical protein U0Q03_07335 [Acidimicrobiales bacterium]
MQRATTFRHLHVLPQPAVCPAPVSERTIERLFGLSEQFAPTERHDVAQVAAALRAVADRA